MVENLGFKNLKNNSWDKYATAPHTRPHTRGLTNIDERFSFNFVSLFKRMIPLTQTNK